MLKHLPINIDVEKLLLHVEKDIDTTEYERKQAENRAKRKAYRERNKEHIAEYNRAYDKSHTERRKSPQRKASAHRYYMSHREQIRAHAKEYAQRPDVKARRAEMARLRRQRKKAEKEQQKNATQDNV